MAGDTVLTDDIRAVIRSERPDVLFLNAGGAFSRGEDGPIIMDAAQVEEVLRLAPEATCIAVHLGCTDHCMVTRESLRRFVSERAPHNDSRLLIPRDGEIIRLPEAEKGN